MADLYFSLFATLREPLSKELARNNEISLSVADILVSQACTHLYPLKKRADPPPPDVAERVGKTSQDWAGLLAALKMEFGRGEMEILQLIFREARRVEKVLAGGKTLKIGGPLAYMQKNCHRSLTYRQNDPEKDWKEALVQEDRKAWEDFYKQFYQKTIELLEKRGCQNDDAIDAWQDTVSDLLEQLKDPERFIDQPLGNYTITLALRKWYNHVRKYKNTSWTDFAVEIPFVEEEVGLEDAYLTAELYEIEKPDTSWLEDISDEVLQFIKQSINKIKNERYRQVLLWIFFEGASREEVAAKIGVTLNTLKTIICRAIEQLREILIEGLKKHEDMAYWLRKLLNRKGQDEQDTFVLANALVLLLLALI